MIKTLDLMAKTFKETDEKIIKLKKEKQNISKEEYKRRLKEIKKQCKQELKQIEKNYPIEKEIEKYLQED